MNAMWYYWITPMVLQAPNEFGDVRAGGSSGGSPGHDRENNEAKRSPETYLAELNNALAKTNRPDPVGVRGWARLFADASELTKWLEVLPALVPPPPLGPAPLTHEQRLRIGEEIARKIIRHRDAVLDEDTKVALPKKEDLQAAAYDSVILCYFAKNILLKPSAGEEHLAEELATRWKSAILEDPSPPENGSPSSNQGPREDSK